jgi:predicted transcriptional regulator/ribosomal protein L37AE/L43A
MCVFWLFPLQYLAQMRTALFKNVLRMHGDNATQIEGGHMAAKRTYSVRLEDDQRQQLESRAESIGLPTGHLIRSAIADFLRQQEEKDYLSEVEMRISTAINRLGRQVEKDRAEQQIVVAIVDYLREWLAFTLPTPVDKQQANDLMRERNKNFLERLPLQFTSSTKAKVTTYMEAQDRAAEPCPKCGTGSLKPKEGKKGVFWYCTNWNASPKCEATFSDADGRPLFPSAETTDQ